MMALYKYVCQYEGFTRATKENKEAFVNFMIFAGGMSATMTANMTGT